VSTPHHPQPSTVTIRRATSADIPGILECLREAFEPYRLAYTPAGFLDTVLTPETLLTRLADMSVFAAITSAGHILGTIACCAATQEEGHLRGMAVSPNQRGTALAALLLDRAEAELHARHCTRITLDTTAPLERAIAFYEKHGYRRSGKVSDFFGMPLYEFQKGN
jgi:ribosomal protein S18 acetylase RimI-like enzyme